MAVYAWKDIEVRIGGVRIDLPDSELIEISRDPSILLRESADYCELAATQSARAELAGRTFARWVSEAIYGN